ncbi:MAG TPA: hypothetical protein VGB73_12215 [Pyrinomonadaceae bacterium]
MRREGNILFRIAASVALVCATWMSVAVAQRGQQSEDAGFGPVVRAYLGYLRAQQEVVDDRVSRREVNRTYYRRNSNRIRALRQMAIRIARETENDYLPELEAVALDELGLLFEEPPKPASLRVGETLNYTLRYLGLVRSGGEGFHLFARLDPYEQAELRKKGEAEQRRQQQTQPAATGVHAPAQVSPGEPTTTTATRPRRINEP